LDSLIVDNWGHLLRKMPSLLLGLLLFALGVVANLYSGLGMSPWGVFQYGIARNIPLTFGQVSQIVGLAVLLLGWALGFPPGLGTLANMFFIGFFIDLIMGLGLIPEPGDIIGQFAMLIVSIALIGVASLFYLRVQLGAGPRDGLMVGLVSRLDRPVSHVRIAIEGTVLVLGYILGGPVGIGTLINALLLGPSVQLAFRLGRFNPKSKQVNLYRLARCLSGDDDLP
jgi:uncharacterized membrane protein YczE